MAIEMCRGTDCPQRLYCYRFMAIPVEPIQEYMSDVPYNLKEANCNHFWRLKLGDEIREEV